MRIPCTAASPLLLCIVIASPLAAYQVTPSPDARQVIEIVLLDGRSGHPVTGKVSHVNVWLGERRKAAVVIGTEKDGVARIELTQDEAQVNVANSRVEGVPPVAKPVFRYSESIWINVPYAWCAPGGSNYSWLATKQLSTRDVLQRGFVSPNTCGKTTMNPKPGQIVVYVRPLTFWESLKE